MSFRIDAHVHTINSDGQYTAKEVLDIAKEKEVKVLVFTDHSGITYNEEIKEYASTLGIEMPLMGIEVSTIHQGHKYHVLGYARNLLDESLQDYMMYPSEVKNIKFRKAIQRLIEKGYKIPNDQDILKGIRNDKSWAHPDKWMLTATLISSYVEQSSDLTIEEAKKIVKTEIAFIESIEEPVTLEEKYLPTLDVIKKLTDYGAVAVIAHPWWECQKANNVNNVIAHFEEFVDAGVRGFEYQSYHVESYLEESGNELSKVFPELLHIGGSDFHGDKRFDLGARGVYENDFNKLLEMIRI